jgi:hypothetical protein
MRGTAGVGTGICVAVGTGVFVTSVARGVTAVSVSLITSTGGVGVAPLSLLHAVTMNKNPIHQPYSINLNIFFINYPL